MNRGLTTGLLLLTTLVLEGSPLKEVPLPVPVEKKLESAPKTPVDDLREKTGSRTQKTSKILATVSPETLEKNRQVNTEEGFWTTGAILEDLLRKRGLPFTLRELNAVPGVGALMWKTTDGALYAITLPYPEDIDLNTTYNLCFQEFSRTEEGEWLIVGEPDLVKSNGIPGLMRKLLLVLGGEPDPYTLEETHDDY
jgi:hypothetical protein